MPIDPLGIETKMVDPLGIGSKGVDPLGIEKGSIQKMNPTPAHDYWGDIGAAIEPLTFHGLLSQPTRLINLIRQGLGKQPYADPDTTFSPLSNDLFTAHPTPQELATNSDYAWMKGQSPEQVGAMNERLAQVELGQRTLGMMPGTGFFGGPQVPPWMLQPNFGRVVPSPQNVPQPTSLIPNDPMFQGLQRDLAIAGGVAQPVNELASTVTSPEGLAMMPAFMATGPVAATARAVMAGQAALQAPESIAHRAQVAGANPSVQNIASALTGSALDLAIPYGMARYHPPVAGPQGIVPSEIRHGGLEMPFQMPDAPRRVFNMPDVQGEKTFTPPIVGQRPLIVGQQFLTGNEKPVGTPPEIVPGLGFSGEPKQGGQISFEGQGIPSAMQSKVIPKGEQSEQAALMKNQFVPSSEEGKLHSGLNPIDLDSQRYKEIEERLGQLTNDKSYGDEFQKLWTESEGIKNRYEGMPPTKLSDEQRKKYEGERLQSGLNPSEGLKDIEGIFTPTSRLLLRDPKRLRYEPSKSGEFDGGQLVNRLMNQVPPIEKELLEKAGIRERFKAGEKVKASDVDQWVGENSPKVQVHEYGMEGKVSEARQEYDKLTHAWFDNLDPRKKDAAYHYYEGKLNDTDIKLLFPDSVDKVKEWVEAKKKVSYEEANVPVDTSPRATTAYKSVSPFDTEKYPVKRVDVVLPLVDRIEKGKNYGSDKSYLWYEDNIHEQLPNTLGWVMMQYKDVGGVKTAVVGEVQSRWGQELRREKELDRRANEGEDMRDVVPADVPNHPLLRDYNRLILKAAIDQARKDGAKRIVLSDAETAMMTEGHDLQERVVANFPTRELAENAAKEVEGGATVEQHRQGRPELWVVKANKLAQESGMRLNYDRILPQIMEELTGGKGEKVELGEHKNAMNSEWFPEGQRQMPDGRVIPERLVQKPRENLIFRNPDNTPKTSVTGLAYDIGEVGKPPYSMFGKKLYSGLSFEPLKELGDRLKNDLTIVGDQFRKRKITDIVAAKRDAVDNMSLQAQNIAENHIKLEATRLFAGEAEKARNAVFAVLEGQRTGGLQQALTKVQGKNKVAEEAVRFAMDPANQQKLIQLTDRVRQLDAQNVALAQSEGIDIQPLDDYMKHMYEQEKTGFFFRGHHGLGTGRGSQQARQYPTIFDAIHGGMKPKSLDAIALVGKRTQEIYQEVKLKKWLDNFRTVLDPRTQEPVVTDLGRLSSPPPGYTKVEGLNVAIKDGYERIFNAVTAESQISKNLVGQAALQGEGAIKHGLLAFDIFHLSRIAQFGQSIKLGVGYKKGLSLLEYSARDLQEAVNQGEAPRDAVNYQNETVTVPQGSWTRRQVGQILIQNGLNVGRHSEALYTAFVRSMPGLKQTIGAFNKFVFDKFSRGVLYELGQREFERVAKADPSLSAPEVARKVSRDLNFRVGNIGRQGIVKSATMQDITQLAFLAPRWVESMAQSEVRSIGQVAGSFGNGGKLGTLGRSSANLLATYIIATQAANYLFNGKSTFENPNNEGHELDLFVPPVTKNGKGFYVSPLSVVAELQHDLLRYTRGSDKTPVGAVVDATSRIVGNKLSPPLQGLKTGLTGRNWKGEPLEGWDRVKEALVTGINPTPLPARQAMEASESEELAPIERQMFSMAGIKAEPESFTEVRQRKAGGKVLGLDQRIEQEKEIDKEKKPQTNSEKIASRERAIAGEIRRGENLKGQMSRADRGWIESRGLTVPGFDNKIHAGGTLVYLTKDETKKLEQYTLEEYNSAMGEIRAKFPMLDKERAPLYFDGRMKGAREKARGRLLKELNR